MSDTRTSIPTGDRLAKVIARAGMCSRRDAEDWIREGRVAVNGSVVKTPAFNVTGRDKISIDGRPLAERKGTRVWLYHKPAGLVVTEKDPEGRPTIFEVFAQLGLPRVLTVGRLDINTEGLLLLTNDGGLKRVLELPATGWLRRYRVRAFGSITQAQLDVLKDGIEIDGIKYGPIEAVLEREQGANSWLVVALREGKNREVKNVLEALGLQVNRLIRVSYGPFQLSDLPEGSVEVVKSRVLRDQLGKRLAEEAGVDFDSELPDEPGTEAKKNRAADPSMRAGPRAKGSAPRREPEGRPRGGHAAGADEDRRIRHRPGRGDSLPPRRPRAETPQRDEPARRILFDDGRPPAEFHPPAERKGRGDRPAKGDRDAGPRRDQDRPPRATRTRDASPDRNSSYADSPRPRRDDDAGRPPRAPRPEGRSFDRPARGPRPEGGADRPARGPRSGAYNTDRPERGPRPEGRPNRPPRVSRPEGGSERPSRGPRTGGYADRPARSPRPEGASERPSRGPRTGGFADRPARGPRPEGGSDRPSRGARPGGYADRPARGPRPEGRPDRPSRGPRSDGGDRPARGPRPEGRGDRPARGPRPEGRSDRPSRGPRPEGTGRPPRGPRPGGPRPPRKPRA